MPETIALEQTLHERLGAFDPEILPSDRRAQALTRFFALPTGRERAGRYWRVDLETIAPDAPAVTIGGASVTIENRSARTIACDLSTASRLHPELLARAFGTTRAQRTKFGSLATAFAQLGAFVYVPADAAADEPIAITYDVAAGAAAFPYTVVLAERGARATVIERCTGEAAFVCGIIEIIAEAGADLTVATAQSLSPQTQFFQTRAARPQRDATVAWACAELGGALAVTELSVAIDGPGVTVHVTNLFFPQGVQHVDVVTAIDHAVGDSASETLVKSAAVDRGQARFLGNIRIAPKAQGSDARLRDDALLLSQSAHIDSVPALEIGANDVKAYHGATVGAIDGEQIFYMETRGIDRPAAERMIALGFFEPAIARFPTNALRDEIRAALEAKLP